MDGGQNCILKEVGSGFGKRIPFLTLETSLFFSGGSDPVLI